jgi:TonB family protein
MKRWVLASALALCASAGWAIAADSPPKGAAAKGSHAQESSRWAQEPTDADFKRMLPAETVKADVPGRAIMRCTAQADGALAGCALIADSNSGAGYGKALLALAGQFRLKPQELATLPADRAVIVPYDNFTFDKAPDWLRKPTARDLLVVWPKAAWSRGIGGKATISCLVSLQGALYDCVTTAESPAGMNFGAAAIALTPQFLMRPATLKGTPVVSEVRIPINFEGGGSGGSIDRTGDGFGEGGVGAGHKVAQAAMGWVEAPSYAQVIAAYPKKAKSEGVVGRATLDCQFTAAGRVEHCQTVVEEPKGQGFADAAKALSKTFRAPEQTGDGKSWSGVDVQLPFAFDRSMQTENIPAVGKPQWAKLPTLEETAAAFSAVSKTVAGTVRVTLTCTVQPGGGVGGCTVAREDPAGKGVGEAALALAPHFRMTTWTMEGLPTIGATINIPLRYEGGPPPTPEAAVPAPAKP